MCPLLSLSLSGYVIIWEDTLSRSSYCYYSIQCTVPVCVCVCVRSYVPVYLRTCVLVGMCVCVWARVVCGIVCVFISSSLWFNSVFTNLRALPSWWVSR